MRRNKRSNRVVDNNITFNIQVWVEGAWCTRSQFWGHWNLLQCVILRSNVLKKSNFSSTSPVRRFRTIFRGFSSSGKETLAVISNSKKFDETWSFTLSTLKESETNAMFENNVESSSVQVLLFSWIKKPVFLLLSLFSVLFLSMYHPAL